MRLVAKPFPIYSECSYVSTFVIHNDNTFPRHGDILWRRKSIWCFQRSQKISKSRVYENWSVWKERMKLIIHNPFLPSNRGIVITIRSGNDQAKLSGNNNSSHRLLVSCEGGSRRWCLTLADDRLSSRVPVPQQNGAIGTSRCYVTIRRDVALAA